MTAPATVEALLPDTSATGGGPAKANTAAADAAADLARTAAAVGEGEGGGPKVGRASNRAKAGFNNKKSKEELIRLGRELAEKYAALQDQLAAQGGGGAQVEVAEAEPLDPATLVPALTTLAAILGGILGAWRGDHWEFSEDEQGKLASASAPVVAKYAGALGEHLDAFVLLVTAAGIVIPRLKQDRKLAEERAGVPAAQRT